MKKIKETVAYTIITMIALISAIYLLMVTMVERNRTSRSTDDLTYSKTTTAKLIVISKKVSNHGNFTVRNLESGQRYKIFFTEMYQEIKIGDTLRAEVNTYYDNKFKDNVENMEFTSLQKYFSYPHGYKD